ncbi:MAG TPA: hypothetical protein VMT19_07515 [Thermoanaerobaculaceae bacterium]|nr:hypothetical protein [Thermoanaerobaculaceae bacterium]
MSGPSPRRGVATAATVTVVAALMLGSAVVTVRQVDDGFKARYTALDLRNPPSFAADPTALGPSPIGFTQWRGARPLVIRGVDVRPGDVLKATVFAECGRGELLVGVGGAPPQRVPARAEWRHIELTLPAAGSEIRWEKATPQPCPVHFSRITIAGFSGEATGLLEGHLVAGRALVRAARWEPRLTGAASPLVAFLGVWGWGLLLGVAARRARLAALWAAAAPVLLLTSFEAYGAITGLWLVTPSRTPVALCAAAAVVAAVVIAAVQLGPRVGGLPGAAAAAARAVFAAVRASARAVRADGERAEVEAFAGDGGWRLPLRQVLVVVMATAVVLAVFAVKVVQDFRGPMLGHGDLDQWLHQADYFAHNFSLRPWPHLDLDNDQLFFPYGGCNVFMPWTFEMDIWTALQNAVFGLGPWLQTYFLFSILVTAVGAFVLLVRECSALRAALLAAALAFANYYAIGKFPGHVNIACAHWAVLGILADGIIVRRACSGRRWSARLVGVRAALLTLSLGLDLGYLAGVSLTSLLVSAAFLAARALVLERAQASGLRARASAMLGELRASFEAHRGQVVALAAVAALAGALYGPLALEVRAATARFDFRGVPMGAWWANPLRMLMPVLPFFNPVRNEWAFQDSHEGLFAASPGAFFVLAALFGLLAAGRRRLTTVPALILLAAFLSFHGNDRPWLRVLPWFTFARVSGRFSSAYPALLVVVGLAVPDGVFRRRAGRIAAALGVALLATEAATAYSVAFTRPRRLWTPDSKFLAMMARIRSTPGAAVLDWPFCIAGGNGVGTGELGRFYGLQAGISSLQVFHGKKIVSTYFGRLHPDQLRPYEAAGWPHMFLPDDRDCGRARKQRRDFLPWEWAFLEEFVKANDFAGIVLYTDILPPATVAGFHARFGQPVASAWGRSYGTIEFIPKSPEWRALTDPARGRRVRLERRPVPWPPNLRLPMTDTRVDDWFGKGWDGANTEGLRAEMTFALERVEPLYWSMRLRPYGRQRISVELNGHTVVPTARLRGTETLTAELPAGWLGTDNRIVLRLPDARSPKSIGYSGDTRVLGVEAEWVQIARHRFPTPPLGVKLAMDRHEVEDFLGPGWGGAEPAYAIRSTRGHRASIRFGLDRIEPLVLALLVETVGRQRLAVELNGTRLWDGTGDGSWIAGALALPAAALRPDNEIVFLLPDARSPRSLGQGPDDRVLGLAARWVEFRPGTR